MDIQVNGLAGSPGSMPSVDFYVPAETIGQHSIAMLIGEPEDKQQAQALCQMVLSSVDQLPGVGNDWPGFLTGKITFGDIDSQVRNTLRLGAHSDYYPDYDIVNGALTVNAVLREVP